MSNSEYRVLGTFGFNDALYCNNTVLDIFALQNTKVYSGTIVAGAAATTIFNINSNMQGTYQITIRGGTVTTGGSTSVFSYKTVKVGAATCTIADPIDIITSLDYTYDVTTQRFKLKIASDPALIKTYKISIELIPITTGLILTCNAGELITSDISIKNKTIKK